MAWITLDDSYQHLLNLECVIDLTIVTLDTSENDYCVNARVTKLGDISDVCVFRGRFEACVAAQKVIAELTGATNLDQAVRKKMKGNDE